MGRSHDGKAETWCLQLETYSLNLKLQAGSREDEYKTVLYLNSQILSPLKHTLQQSICIKSFQIAPRTREQVF